MQDYISTSLDFDLPEWQESDFSKIHHLREQLKTIAIGAGSNSDRFRQVCIKVKEGFQNPLSLNLPNILTDRIDIRALTYLLITDASFAGNVLIDKALLEHLQGISNPLSKLSLIQLIRAYLVYYDQITTKEGLLFWSSFIQKQLRNSNIKQVAGDLQKHLDNDELIFGKNAPEKLAKNAQLEQVDLDSYMKRLGLEGYDSGRYLTLVKNEYYLQQLEVMPVGEANSLLAELVKPQVFDSPYQERALGHRILEIMIDRSAGKPLSDPWRSVILSIAGDPRVPKSHRKYQRWWALLGENRVALVRGWLSQFDLSLFLRVLEQSAKDGSNYDMERMFKPRKAFIEGLEKSGLIAESRLFLSHYAESYLRRHYKLEELPNYARVTSNDTSMIYVNIDRKVHMIEGSHSFRLKLMDKLPSRCRVDNHDLTSFSDGELRSSVVYQYSNQFNNLDGILEATHDIHLNWQYKAINFLRRNGLRINASDVIEIDRHREFKAKFGA